MYNPENQRVVEFLVLLLLGSSKRKKLSVLHLEKELFYLWNASEYIKPFIEFIAHYRGPFSSALAETIKSPMYLEDCWEYKPKNDISGGFVELTRIGEREYKRLIDKIYLDDKKLEIRILAAMELLHDLYDDLNSEELLYLIYTNPRYKEYTLKSDVYNCIVTDTLKNSLIRKLCKPILEEE